MRSLKQKILVERFWENPLLIPEDVDWIMNRYPEKERGVLNCGVIHDKENKVFRMLYRGGSGSFSDVGYAESEDGKDWRKNLNRDAPVLRHSDNRYWSNYCRRGIEDPRIVKARWTNGYYYIFATACSEPNFDPIKKITGRVGIWRTLDFKEFQWITCPFNNESKNASIFPELIDGKVWLLHRIFPDIWITCTEDLTLRSGWTKGKILVKASRFYKNPTRVEIPHKIGIAGPPIKTPKGWLVITHVVHKSYVSDWWKYSLGTYSLGFMVLNLEDPTKVIYIHPEPILWPETNYEISGNTLCVCFSCATVDPDPDGNEIYIYWGGADTVVAGGKLKKADLTMCY